MNVASEPFVLTVVMTNAIALSVEAPLFGQYTFILVSEFRKSQPVRSTPIQKILA